MSDEMPGFDALLQQAMQLQEQLLAAQAEAEATEVQGHAGGGAVTVTMTGGGEVQRIRIDPAVVDPADVELLEDLIVAALHDAATQARAQQASMLGGLGGLGLAFGDLPDEDEDEDDDEGLAALGALGPGEPEGATQHPDHD